MVHLDVRSPRADASPWQLCQIFAAAARQEPVNMAGVKSDGRCVCAFPPWGWVVAPSSHSGMVMKLLPRGASYCLHGHCVSGCQRVAATVSPPSRHLKTSSMVWKFSLPVCENPLLIIRKTDLNPDHVSLFLLFFPAHQKSSFSLCAKHLWRVGG